MRSFSSMLPMGDKDSSSWCNYLSRVTPSRRQLEPDLSHTAQDSKSAAAGAGFATIAEVGRERIRRASKQILDGDVHKDWNKDVGFRVLKINSSNMSDVLRTPDQVSQAQMFEFTDSVKTDRTGEDLLFQVLLDWGLELTMPI